MENSHRENVLVTSCLKTPVDPHTKVPLALYERERALQYAPGNPLDTRYDEKEVEYNSDSDRSEGGGCRGEGGGRGPAPGGGREASGAWMGPLDLLGLCSSNEEYCQRLDELRRAHLHTMDQLERMCRARLDLGGRGGAEGGRSVGPDLAWHRASGERSDSANVRGLRKAFSAVELERLKDDGLSDASEEGSANQDAAMGRSLLASPREQIRTMWEDFSVSALAPRDRPNSPVSQSKAQGDGRGRGEEERGESERVGTWRHRVTVPRPFQMTLREAERKRRGQRSRSELQLEDERLRRELAERAECQRKFRAGPVPAHVYLPLYQELAARDRDRRLAARLRGPAPHSQQPFGFLERERRRKEEREAALKDRAREEGGGGRPFRAKPVPRAVYDATVTERMREEQLYRAIKMQMRSRELLLSASLPPSMLGRQLRARREEEEEEGDAGAGGRSEADFRPRVSGEVPDFEAGYRRFRERLRDRRETRPTTVCEPFQLRTAAVRQRRQTTPDPAPSRPRPQTTSSSLGSSHTGSLELLLPAKTTDAAMKRQEAVRRVLDARKRAEEEEESLGRRRRKRERRLQRMVSRRAQANDPHGPLSQTGTAKLRQLRKQEVQRRKEYEEEMREMRERVKGRPLLLEQVTQRNAKQAAERRYAAALRGAGLSEDVVRDLAPKRTRRQPHDDRSKEQSGQESSAGDYADDYEELDDPELSGGEKGEEEDNRDYNDDSGEEEEEDEEDEDSFKADRDVDENNQ